MVTERIETVTFRMNSCFVRLGIIYFGRYYGKEKNLSFMSHHAW